MSEESCDASGPRSELTEALSRSLDCWLTKTGTTSERWDDESLDPAALAAIVYTSGTTGRPKGVMLTHRNIVSNVNSIMSVMRVRDHDVFLSFLPLSHTLERTVGYYLAMAAGASVAFARSVPLLMDDLRVVRPTILVSVPRIYERAVAVLQERIGSSRLRQWGFTRAVNLGWRYFEHVQSAAPDLPVSSRVMWAVLDRLIGSQIRKRFGGRLRAAVTGGAAIAPDVARPLLALGIPIVQGYGLTECSPVIASNTGSSDRTLLPLSC